jgi:hypothetical protein
MVNYIKKLFNNTQKNGVVRHISCICYNDPDIKSFLPQIQDYIIAAEQKRGNKITPTSRISSDCFSDNNSLDVAYLVRGKLEEFYRQAYQQDIIPELLNKTIAREVVGVPRTMGSLFDMSDESEVNARGIDNCRPLAKCFVLYE